MPSPELRRRTHAFAVAIVRYCVDARIPPRLEPLIGQTLRSGTAIAANYRAAERSRSTREFAARLAIVVEEADETELWLDLIGHGAPNQPGTDALRGEAGELRSIFASARSTTLAKLPPSSTPVIGCSRPASVSAPVFPISYFLSLIFFSSAAYASFAARDPRIQPITTPTRSTAGMKRKWLAGTGAQDFRAAPRRVFTSASSRSTRPRRRQIANTYAMSAAQTKAYAP